MTTEQKTALTADVAGVCHVIADILRRGNDAEVKRVRGQIVVVEIERKVRIKADERK